jgi:hypothetical protein
MSDLVPLWVAISCALLALLNVPLLLLKPSAAEQRLWRRLHVRRARRRLTRKRGAGEIHTHATIVAVATRNIAWHLVLSLLISLLMLHPALRTFEYRGAVYAFALLGCIAYVVGSVVQRQKIVVIANRAVDPAPV